MRSNAKVSSKKKSIKNTASNTKTLDGNEHPKEIEVVNSGANKKRKLSGKKDINTTSLEQDSRYLEDVVVHNDLWMLKYDINENGIGKILLPPSLSILLQSDRVSISPSSGGLFIRSI
ncbi:Uncharacterised protein [uncultured archaeon]|nr:Uncharacterised protein [uncultured archaeon]